MEDLRPKIMSAVKNAMKSKDNQRRDVLRLLQSAIKQVEIDTQKDLSPEDVVSIVQKEAKKRRESIADMKAAGREEQIPDEQAELDIIEEFLPQQLSEDEVSAIVKDVITETGASSQKEMGQVMSAVMQKVKGQADGKLVNKIVREQLSG